MERLGPSLKQLQSLETREAQLTKRLSKLEGMYDQVKRPEIPREQWSPTEHLMAAKVNQLTNVHQKVGTTLFAASSQLDQAVLAYHENYQEPSENEQKRREFAVLKRMAARGLTEDLSVEQVDQQIRDFEQSQNPLSDSLQQRLNTLLQRQPETPQENLSEEETQRRQALLEVIVSFDNLTILERKSLEKGIIYSQEKPGFNKDWAKLMNYGERVSEADAVNRLLLIRKKALDKTKSRIEMGNVRRGREVAHYLILKETARKEFGEEPVTDVVLNLLNTMITNPSLTLEKAIQLRGLMSNGRPFNRYTLQGSLSHATNVLMRRTRDGKLSEAEKNLVDSIHSIFNGERVKNSLVALRQNIYKWIKEGTPIIPVKEQGRPSRHGTREKQTINMPDDTVLEVHGKRGKGIQFLVSNTEAFSVKDFANFLHGSDNQSAIRAAKSTLRDIKNYLASLGWVVNLPQDLKDVDLPKTFSLTKAQVVSTEQPEQLEQSIASLEESRVSIVQAAGLEVPGAKEHLADLDQLLAQKREALEQLREAH